MFRRGLRGTWACSRFGRRFFNNTSADAAPGAYDGDSKPIRKLQKARLWAMERVSKSKFQRLISTKAWRIPACLDYVVDWLPEGLTPLLYVDKLQVHQYYWKLGETAFICTPFQLDIYERYWEKNFERSKVLASLDVYPHLMNKNEDQEIVNLTLVSPKHWGKRCLLHYFGEQDCIGSKKGGILKKTLTYVALDCGLDLSLPDVQVDVSKLDVGDEIAVKDLNLNFKLMPNLSLTTTVCKVLPPGVLEQESPELQTVGCV